MTVMFDFEAWINYVEGNKYSHTDTTAVTLHSDGANEEDASSPQRLRLRVSTTIRIRV